MAIAPDWNKNIAVPVERRVPSEAGRNNPFQSFNTSACGHSTLDFGIMLQSALIFITRVT